MAEGIAGTEGYAAAAAGLLERRLPFALVHAAMLHLLPTVPASVLDVGAGPGHDAAALAGLGHRVVAVEPVDALRLPAMALHRCAAVEWIDDHLPMLAALAGRAGQFDLAMLTGVWMHLDAGQRREAMPKLAALLRQDGRLLMTLRHGPVPRGRRMFQVSEEETVALAAEQGLELLFRGQAPSIQAGNRRAGVTWSHLAFARHGKRGSKRCSPPRRGGGVPDAPGRGSPDGGDQNNR